MKWGKIIWQEAAELLYPRRCPVCDGVIGWHQGMLCKECSGIRILQEPLCRKCGKSLEQEDAEYCYDCRHKIHKYIEGAALFHYQEAKESIYRFKYKGRQEYAAYYAQETVRHLGRRIKSWNAQALIPVPIHAKRRKCRGYNQAELYAGQLAGLLGIPMLEQYAIRCKNTVPQKTLDNADRQNNLKRAFKIPRNDVKLDTLIIVDDIYTTGSTIDALADTCIAAGAARVYFIALAIGDGL